MYTVYIPVGGENKKTKEIKCTLTKYLNAYMELCSIYYYYYYY